VSDKTEEPTPRRLKKAREEGDSGASAFAAQSFAFLAAVAVAPACVGALASGVSARLREVIAGVAVPHAAVRFDPGELARSVVVFVLPLLLSASLAGAVAQAVQTGGVIATQRLAPKLARLDPIQGLKGLVSPSRLFAVLRALVAALSVGLFAYVGVREHIVDIARVAGRPSSIGPVVGVIARGLAWRAAFLGLALGVVDVIVVRGVWRRKLRMTKDEVKREHRESEGDPQIKAARDHAYKELLAQATVANVRAASVVVINPTHLACALRYDQWQGDEAPLVVASGEGELAARIVALASDCGVPIVRNMPLARALVAIEIGQAIPEGLYEAVAEILREVWDRR
jgi:type III secretion protein U